MSIVQSQSDLYEPCFATTDHVIRNIKIDPATRKITTFLHWDDVYVMPFLLCSRYPEDICWFDRSGERWYKTGGFLFLPFDEEGEIEEDSIPETVQALAKETYPEAVDDDDDATSEDTASENADRDRAPELDGSGGSPKVEEGIPDHNPTDYDRLRRIKDTRLRRQYEQMLIAHDTRFGLDGLWETRTDPLKNQHRVLHGWIEWLSKEVWVWERAVEMGVLLMTHV